MDFFAIDVETANSDIASICQIGIAHYRDGKIVDEWVSYIDPEAHFSRINTSIHGIDKNTVSGAPNFNAVSDTLYGHLDNNIAVCHTHFDRAAIRKAAKKYGLRLPNCRWLDSSLVARKTWPEFSKKGYGLRNLCEFLGYSFQHHDALEDAKAAGHILVAATIESGTNFDALVKEPYSLAYSKGKREGEPAVNLHGEVIVFTGRLEIPRSEAAEMATNMGCRVVSSVSKKTTLLVVGDQDIDMLAGHERSSKHRKAEKLILNGTPIRILGETDFKDLIAAS